MFLLSFLVGGFDVGVVKCIVWFLEVVVRDRGVEYWVVKNLVRVRLVRERVVKRWRVVLMEDKYKYVFLVFCFYFLLVDCMEVFYEFFFKFVMFFRVE